MPVPSLSQQKINKVVAFQSILLAGYYTAVMDCQLWFTHIERLEEGEICLFNHCPGNRPVLSLQPNKNELKHKCWSPELKVRLNFQKKHKTLQCNHQAWLLGALTFTWDQAEASGWDLKHSKSITVISLHPGINLISWFIFFNNEERKASALSSHFLAL